MAVILFWRTPEISFGAIVWPSTRYSRLVLLLFGAMPFFSFLGLWDSYLSAALYSGNEIQADVIISPKVHDRLAKAIQRHCKARGGTFVVDLDSWSMGELGVPSYPARRVFRCVARSFCALAAEPADVVLLIHEAPHWRTGIRQQTREDCGALHGALLGPSFRVESASMNSSGADTLVCRTGRSACPTGRVDFKIQPDRREADSWRLSGNPSEESALPSPPWRA